MDISRLTQARGLLASVTPMNADCGRYCGAACCKPDDDGRGSVALFPGEEALIDPAIRVVTQDGQKLACCDGTCRREGRPLGCMIFPLTPAVDDYGVVTARFDVRARPVCPLLRNGLMGLRRDFREAVTRALSLIAEDEEGLAFLRDWQSREAAYHFEL